MRFIFLIAVVIVVLAIKFGYDLLEKFFTNKQTPKSQPKDLEELEKEVEEKTKSYNEVVESVEKTEEKVKKIKKKVENKK